MNQSNGQETKQCPRCDTTVLERRPICRKCGFRFPMSCEGCGREVVGRVFCPECIEPGVYHFQRTESLESSPHPMQSLQPTAEKADIFLDDPLIGPVEHEFTC